mgnify:CR=1 FL=1|jgi:hypothetical protein
MDLAPQRHADETFEDYKSRRKAGREYLAIKASNWFHVSKYVAYEDGLPTTQLLAQPLTYRKGMEPRR